MEILIAAVGKSKRDAEAALVDHYLRQTRWKITLHEITDAPARLSRESRQTFEAAKIEALVGASDRLITLDAGGEQMTSEALANCITNAMAGRSKKLVFAIGGQDGLAPALIKKATHRLAFGRVTWPHRLMRVMLAEQIFRAYTIHSGHPYHTGH
ncbi:MAG: 23S rRNA (pseudouridine(1915)-N(3))-methyltransferase RlmH [Alphaproteobacteria bacterium]